MGARHKGIMSDATLDRRWPHQVALHAEICRDDQFHPIHRYGCELGAAPRWRHVQKLVPDRLPQTYNLVCFAAREAAEIFIGRFGGRHFDPVADREKPKRLNIWTWKDWGNTAERFPEIIARLERVRSWEPDLDLDVARLLGLKAVPKFTREQGEVEAFLAGRIPNGEWNAGPVERALIQGFDAGVRHGPDGALRHACENTTKPRDCPATALTLAYLRGCARQFMSGAIAVRQPAAKAAACA